MSSVTNIPVEELKRRRDVRPLNNDAVAALADSIYTIGLVNPIRVRKIDDGFEIIAGSHRFAACDSLDWRDIPCLIVDDDDLHAELAMIDENLCRAELSPADRAKQTARRKAIYLELHPETAAGISQAAAMNAAQERGGQVVHDVDRFDVATAKATGKDERSVRRDAERGEKVTDEAVDVIRGTRLDTGAYLDKLKRLPSAEQVEVARQDLATVSERPRGGITNRIAPAETAPSQPSRTFERFVSLVDQVEGLPITDLIAGAGRQRSVLGQRASGLIDRLTEIIERLDQ